MPSRERIRCARCHKRFTGSAKVTLCPDCERLVRQERAVAKASAAAPSAQGTPATAPRIMGVGAPMLDPRLASMPSVTSPEAPADAPAQPRHADRRDQTARGATAPLAEKRTERPHDSHDTHETRNKSPHSEKPPRARESHAQREKRPPTPPTPPFELTADVRARIEARYLELANPVEFDGIRTQIATELSIPKAAVKRAVHELRGRMQLPSWWELQSYSGTREDLERIRDAYMPHLPVPDVGIHTRLANDLDMDPRSVYQGIRRIRAEMRLPQYNPPAAHGLPPLSTPTVDTPEQVAPAT